MLDKTLAYLSTIDDRMTGGLKDLAMAEVKALRTLPEIVCLCGSTRFMQEFIDHNRLFTLEGKIVLGPGVYVHPEAHNVSEAEKTMLDALHFRKIDLASRVHILNIDGYIGQSTHNEVTYAIKNDKLVTFAQAQVIPWDTRRKEPMATIDYVRGVKHRIQFEDEARA